MVRRENTHRRSAHKCPHTSPKPRCEKLSWKTCSQDPEHLKVACAGDFPNRTSHATIAFAYSQFVIRVREMVSTSR